MPHKLSPWDKVDAFVGWFSVALGLVYAVISGPFRGRSEADTYYHHVIQAGVKKLTTRFSPLQLQYLFKSYDHIYLDYCRKNGMKPHFVSNDRGAKGFWIGDPSAKYIVISFHGGGFAMDATEAYLYFWPRIQKTLTEAVETLRYVLEDLGRSPGDVLIIGDSAGGSLCLAILSHLKHRSEDIPELVINKRIKGAILLSPWISFSHEWPSAKLNKDKDVDTQEVTERWSQEYLRGQISNNYTEAANAPEEWWNDMPVEQTLVLAGADEVLLDAIETWVSKFKKSNPDTALVVGAKECHTAPLTWPLFGDFHETEQERALKHWMLERLG